METDSADRAVRSFVSEADLLTECQGELDVVKEQVEHLRTALVTARRIGAAIGILMAQRSLTDDDAFHLLRQVSQQQHRKLRDVADDVVYTGALPTTSAT